ncbi:hypothetical protein [Mesorhizobium sp. ES1-4]|uniref:hypothetical protein n=1 Tax=Mesorhizobium sp. ES1-4 TaxID=2876627 RepID=UPI001CCE04DA|nr:hypothetical protein [Mesorhizobium sp. ES1-4]MBZ9797217.1 hypothetical protein [Mesorhizobium sp. ES1-4]
MSAPPVGSTQCSAEQDCVFADSRAGPALRYSKNLRHSNRRQSLLPLPMRLMAGLAILKNTFGLSNKEQCARWLENP